MADVFFSYTHSERERLVPLVTELTALGLTVWFDVSIPTGSSYEEVIATELEAARTVIVCWSNASTKSKWVRSEAAFALDQGSLVPCFLERCVLKPPFNTVQTEDLSEWRGDVGSPAWRKLVERIGSVVERPGLLNLMDALRDPVGERLGQWIRTFPADPFISSALTLWRVRQREHFSQEMQAAAARLDHTLTTRNAAAKTQLAAMGPAMEQWLSRGVDSPNTERPRPDRLLQTLLGDERDDRSVDPEVLSAAVKRADEENARASKLNRDNAYLKNKIAEIEKLNNEIKTDLVEKSAIEELSSRTTSKPGRFMWGLAGALALALGILLSYSLSQKAYSSDASARAATELAETKRSLNASIDGLNQENARLAEALKTAETSRDAVAGQLTAALAENAKLKGTAASTGTREPPPRIPVLAIALKAASTCTEEAGSLFDQDNPTHQGVFDLMDSSSDALDSAVSNCSIAIKGASGEPEKRRLLAQLGRAYMYSAVQEKHANDDALAQKSMKLALSELKQAEQSGSAFAMQLLGSFYQGIPGLEASDPSFFGEPDPSRAIALYKEAADLGDPAAMASLARMMLDKGMQGEFDPHMIASLLTRAEGMQYPRAFETHASAWLDSRMYPGTTEVERRRKAAALLDQERCLGYAAAVDKFYSKNILLISYKSNSACN